MATFTVCHSCAAAIVNADDSGLDADTARLVAVFCANNGMLVADNIDDEQDHEFTCEACGYDTYGPRVELDNME